MNASHPVNTAHLVRRADSAASRFDEAGAVHAHTRHGLLERLEPVSVKAGLVADLGCGTGGSVRALEKRFRGARVIGLDQSLPMLAAARARRHWLSRAAFVCSRANALPLPAHSVDVVFSNLFLPGVDDPRPVAAEVGRVLCRDGLFAFATLGPDSLSVLRGAWAAVDDEPHVQRFPDMHDLGDLLVRAGLRDPVLDVDRLTVEYRSVDALFRDLTLTGARNVLADRRRSLTGKSRFERMRAALEATGRAGGEGAPLQVELELIYGHCWGSGRRQADGEVHIPAGTIPRRRR